MSQLSFEQIRGHTRFFFPLYGTYMLFAFLSIQVFFFLLSSHEYFPLFWYCLRWHKQELWYGISLAYHQHIFSPEFRCTFRSQHEEKSCIVGTENGTVRVPFAQFGPNGTESFCPLSWFTTRASAHAFLQEMLRRNLACRSTALHCTRILRHVAGWQVLGPWPWEEDSLLVHSHFFVAWTIWIEHTNVATFGFSWFILVKSTDSFVSVFPSSLDGGINQTEFPIHVSFPFLVSQYSHLTECVIRGTTAIVLTGDVVLTFTTKSPLITGLLSVPSHKFPHHPFCCYCSQDIQMCDSEVVLSGTTSIPNLILILPVVLELNPPSWQTYRYDQLIMRSPHAKNAR
jgi:hypothetical protein